MSKIYEIDVADVAEIKPFKYQEHAETVLNLLPKGTRFWIPNVHKKTKFCVVKTEADAVLAVYQGNEHLYPQEYPDVSIFPIQGLCEYYAKGELELLK